MKIRDLFSKLSFPVFVKIMFVELSRKLFFRTGRFFFSQHGEDINAMYLVHKFSEGFYIDIGSNEPISYSNTFKLYVQGWKGILVDGNKGLIEKSKRIRKKDTCVHAIVSNEKKQVNFYLAENNLMSSMDDAFVKSVSSNNYKPQFITMETMSVNEIIEQHVPAGQQIDLLSIDVEGHDFEVLQSIDLHKYRPTLIIIEDLDHKSTLPENNVLVRHLKNFNYHLVSTDRLNLYFMSAHASA